MKKLLPILTATLLAVGAITQTLHAATADLEMQSVQGSAVIDGQRDAAYDGALTIIMDQQGFSAGTGEILEKPAAKAYVLNDSDYVYVYFDVFDESLDNTSVNTHEHDSAEIFWMDDNKKVQLRYHYDGRVDENGGTNAGSAATVTESGFAVEAKFPITDVLDNKIEVCFQINVASEGAREYTVFASGHTEGDHAWQRSGRHKSDYDCWWTLALAGDHADSRKEISYYEQQFISTDLREDTDKVNASLSAAKMGSASVEEIEEALNTANDAMKHALSLQESSGFKDAAANHVKALGETVAQIRDILGNAKAAEAANQTSSPAADNVAEPDSDPGGDAENAVSTWTIIGIIIAALAVMALMVFMLRDKKKK